MDNDHLNSVKKKKRIYFIRDQFFLYLICDNNIKVLFHEVYFYISMIDLSSNNYSIINLKVFSDEIIKRLN